MRFPVVFFLVFAIGLLVLVWFSGTGQPESVSASAPDSASEKLQPREELLTVPEKANDVARVAPTSAHSSTAAAETEVAPDSGNTNVQTLPLRPSTGIRGRLRFEGIPVAGAAVSLVGESIDLKRAFRFENEAMGGNLFNDVRPLLGRTRTVGSDLDGSFSFEDLAPGTYALQIDADYVAREHLRGLEVTAEQMIQLGDVVLQPEATIGGVLLMGVGQSAQGFLIQLDPPRGRSLNINNVEGRFEFTGLEAGAHTITWSRPTQNSWTDDDPHLQSLELAGGEAREIVLDATASTACTVIVRVLREGAPVEGVRVLARIRSLTKSGAWRRIPLGTSDEDGTIEGEVEGDDVFELEAVTESSGPIVTTGAEITATPEGRIERTIELFTGRLTLELPASIRRPEYGWVRVKLEAPGREPRTVCASSRADRRQFQKSDWNDPRIEFGEFQTGEYEVTVEIERLGDNGAGPVALRAPYKTKVTIEHGREVKIVVP